MTSASQTSQRIPAPNSISGMDCLGVFFDHKTFRAEQSTVDARQMPFAQLPLMAPLSARDKNRKTSRL
jgi:hypothetical protein